MSKKLFVKPQEDRLVKHDLKLTSDAKNRIDQIHQDAKKLGVTLTVDGEIETKLLKFYDTLELELHAEYSDVEWPLDERLTKLLQKKVAARRKKPAVFNAEDATKETSAIHDTTATHQPGNPPTTPGSGFLKFGK